MVAAVLELEEGFSGSVGSVGEWRRLEGGVEGQPLVRLGLRSVQLLVGEGAAVLSMHLDHVRFCLPETPTYMHARNEGFF